MLFETYVKLVSDFPEGCDQLFGQPLNSDSSLWLSVDGEAYPSLLFTARLDDHRSDIELRSISAHFSRDCTIDAADGASASGIYTIVSLRENDPDIVRMLLLVLEETFNSARAPFSNRDIASSIQELANLFKKIGGADRDIVGLWGELYILSCADNVESAVRCWCSHKMAKYDFVTSGAVLEVKTTTSSRRKHRFSLDQLRPNDDFQVYIASLNLVELNSGSTTAELMEEIYSQIIETELRASFLRQCLMKGGQDIYRNSMRLSAFPDGTSLAVFDATDLPVPEISPKTPIDNVRFDLDLTEFVSISHATLTSILSSNGE
ncbi:PD-(D/E)XK motif protein [Psychromarinibacter halotolerans]|uniref:PD-(D/E)XK motif protein n=1 Tax=Psychromarinibacter halotolerans TaxID=1775175 RepID=A0ABV7GZ67_9RHOB|nr:PD-(D/E)XK motif protein [Psychromarinibacter halotolerans]MDF0596314.1 PD-(D/E)XK motif protein [Psychromarinibacter halotolerans]